MSYVPILFLKVKSHNAPLVYLEYAHQNDN
jgi:hypothetical protein